MDAEGRWNASRPGMAKRILVILDWLGEAWQIKFRREDAFAPVVFGSDLCSGYRVPAGATKINFQAPSPRDWMPEAGVMTWNQV